MQSRDSPIFCSTPYLFSRQKTGCIYVCVCFRGESSNSIATVTSGCNAANPAQLTSAIVSVSDIYIVTDRANERLVGFYERTKPERKREPDRGREARMT